jgi:hypothetical protein
MISDLGASGASTDRALREFPAAKAILAVTKEPSLALIFLKPGSAVLPPSRFARRIGGNPKNNPQIPHANKTFKFVRWIIKDILCMIIYYSVFIMFYLFRLKQNRHLIYKWHGRPRFYRGSSQWGPAHQNPSGASPQTVRAQRIGAQYGTRCWIPVTRQAASMNPVLQGSALRQALEPGTTKIQARRGAKSRRSSRVSAPGSCARD